MKKICVRYLKKGILVVLLGLIFFFFTKQLITNWNKLVDYEWRFNYILLILSVIIYILVMFFHSLNWYIIFKKLGEKLEFYKAAKIWLLGLAAKYLPGTVWQYFGQIHLCKKEGIAKTKTITVQIIEFSMNTISALFIFLISIFFWEKRIIEFKEIIILITVVLGIIIFLRSPLLKQLINFSLRIIKREPIDFNFKSSSIFFIFSLYVVLRFIQGIAFYLFVSSMHVVPLKMLPILIGVFSISWVAGYLFVIAPGGLGIREGAFAFFLNSLFPLPIAIAISLFARLWVMVSEGLAILIGFSIKRE